MFVVVWHFSTQHGLNGRHSCRFSRMRSEGLPKIAFVTATVHNCLQPFATVCVRSLRVSHAQMLPEWSCNCIRWTCFAADIVNNGVCRGGVSVCVRDLWRIMTFAEEVSV